MLWADCSFTRRRLGSRTTTGRSSGSPFPRRAARESRHVRWLAMGGIIFLQAGRSTLYG
jgi:hypothetical protein